MHFQPGQPMVRYQINAYGYELVVNGKQTKKTHSTENMNEKKIQTMRFRLISLFVELDGKDQ